MSVSRPTFETFRARIRSGCRTAAVFSVFAAALCLFSPAPAGSAEPAAAPGAPEAAGSAMRFADETALSGASILGSTFDVDDEGRIWPHSETFFQTGAAPRIVTIGIPDTTDIGLQRPLLMKTMEQLGRAMPEALFRVRVILSADGPTQLKSIRPDFVFAPAGAEAMWRREGIEANRIATRKSILAQEAARSTGSVIVALKSRKDINTLADLKDKRIAAGLPNSVPGWLAVLGEVHRAGFDEENFFGSVEFLSEYYPEIIASLWGGWADAVVFPTCYVEALGMSGLVAVDELKVVNDLSDEALSCRRSTALYPDVSLMGFSWTDPSLLRDVTVALLAQKAEGDDEWISFVPHASVDALFRDLRAGPYRYLRDTSLAGIYERHSLAFQLAGAALLSLILYGILLQVLVRRRTRELTRTLAEQRRMEEEAREHRRRLGNLERRNIVNQMSGMIAHEINSPVGAICNFKAILDLLLADRKAADRNVATALDGIETEAQRIAGIVGRVRGYAKSKRHAHRPCDLVAISRAAVRALFVSATVKATIEERYACQKAPVLGDSLELELLVLNLLRNASEVHPASGGRPTVTLTVSRLPDGRCRLEVVDNGSPMDESAFEKLTAVTSSAKPEGLGMGLSIVRGIADSHGAELAFARSQSAGLRVMFTIDAWEEPVQDRQTDSAGNSDTDTTKAAAPDAKPVEADGPEQKEDQ